MVQFWEHLPDHERVLVDILRQIVLENLPATCREKLAYNVPCYYGNKRICLLWPASVPGGGFKKGVLLGFSQGYKLKDPSHYLSHGTNKRIYYKIFYSPDEIDEIAISAMEGLLKEAVALDSKK
jgi:hypothetical protein